MALAHSLSERRTHPRPTNPSVPTSDLFRVDGRTILITGGAGAMGLTIARSVIEMGGDVVLVDLPESPPREEYESILSHANHHSAQVTYTQCDVTSPASMSSIFTNIVQRTRYPLRGMVTCAGISDAGPSISYPIDKFKKVHDVNVTGNFICCQEAAKEFTRLGVQGSIVIVASMSGFMVNKGVDTAAYNSSKAALHQLARSLASEWGSSPSHPLIRVNTLSPGYIRTAATAGALEEKPTREKEWSGDNMLNRLSEIDEFRGPIMFLLGDGSSFMTGADLRVDGGHCAW